jgi:hypothetical protein
MTTHFEEMFLTVQERDIVLSDLPKESPIEKVHRMQQKGMRRAMDESCSALVKKVCHPLCEGNSFDSSQITMLCVMF